MGRPVQDIAQLIENQDTEVLSALPGIGAAMAERIVAKLRRKMSKFALLVAQPQYEAEVERDVVTDTFEILRQLGHSDVDARKLLDSVLASKKKYKDVDALLNAVYQQSHAK
jgi:Holliday junction DNA helicase RuvA